jgi:hypothetical protein
MHGPTYIIFGANLAPFPPQAEGLVGHIGLGTHDKPHAPLHRRFLEDPDAEVLLTVNDWNLLRRYGGEPRGAITAAADADAGVMNAGAFYMGMLSGISSPGRQSHSDIALYFSSVILYTKYTGLLPNDFNVDG